MEFQRGIPVPGAALDQFTLPSDDLCFQLPAAAGDEFLMQKSKVSFLSRLHVLYDSFIFVTPEYGTMLLCCEEIIVHGKPCLIGMIHALRQVRRNRRGRKPYIPSQHTGKVYQSGDRIEILVVKSSISSMTRSDDMSRRKGSMYRPPLMVWTAPIM